MIRTPVLEKAANASSVQGVSHQQCLLLLSLLHPRSSHKNKTRRKNDNNSQNDKSCNGDAIIVLLHLIWR
jgi:hypothetical protein